MVVTSLNLLPCGRLEGGRIAQALFGRNTATLLSFGTSLLLGMGGLSGSVLWLAWGLFATFRGGEVPATDEINPLGDDRYARGFVLGLIYFLTLFPSGGGTFSSSFFSDPFFRGNLFFTFFCELATVLSHLQLIQGSKTGVKMKENVCMIVFIVHRKGCLQFLSTVQVLCLWYAQYGFLL